MIVYVITEGDYSDYHIIGVTLDKQFAKDFCERHNRPEYFQSYRVEEYNTDHLMAFTKDMHLWRVFLEKGILRADMDDGAVSYFSDCINQVNRHYNGKRPDERWYTTYVVAKDEEHAEKIGYDLIMQSRYRKEIEEGR